MCGAANLVVVFLPSPSPTSLRPAALQAVTLHPTTLQEMEFLPADIDRPPGGKRTRGILWPVSLGASVVADRHDDLLTPGEVKISPVFHQEDHKYYRVKPGRT